MKLIINILQIYFKIFKVILLNRLHKFHTHFQEAFASPIMLGTSWHLV
jgi:hypothetical protein